MRVFNIENVLKVILNDGLSQLLKIVFACRHPEDALGVDHLLVVAEVSRQDDQDIRDAVLLVYFILA